MKTEPDESDLKIQYEFRFRQKTLLSQKQKRFRLFLCLQIVSSLDQSVIKSDDSDSSAFSSAGLRVTRALVTR